MDDVTPVDQSPKGWFTASLDGEAATGAVERLRYARSRGP